VIKCIIILTTMFWRVCGVGIRRSGTVKSCGHKLRVFFMCRWRRSYECFQIRCVSNLDSHYGWRPASVSRCRVPFEFSVAVFAEIVGRSPSTKFEHSQLYDWRHPIQSWVMWNAHCRLRTFFRLKSFTCRRTSGGVQPTGHRRTTILVLVLFTRLVPFWCQV